MIIEVKCTINAMCLNHPENIPSLQLSMEKLSSVKPVPGAKKAGDGWYKVCSSKKVKPAFNEGISPNFQGSGNTGG